MSLSETGTPISGPVVDPAARAASAAAAWARVFSGVQAA